MVHGMYLSCTSTHSDYHTLLLTASKNPQTSRLGLRKRMVRLKIASCNRKSDRPGSWSPPPRTPPPPAPPPQLPSSLQYDHGRSVLSILLVRGDRKKNCKLYWDKCKRGRSVNSINKNKIKKHGRVPDPSYFPSQNLIDTSRPIDISQCTLQIKVVAVTTRAT